MGLGIFSNRGSLFQYEQALKNKKVDPYVAHLNKRSEVVPEGPEGILQRLKATEATHAKNTEGSVFGNFLITVFILLLIAGIGIFINFVIHQKPPQP